MSDKKVSVSRVIPAPPDRVFDVLADPSLHPQIDGSGSVRGALGNPTRLSLGAKFGMSMRIGLPYFVRNTVKEFDEGRRIAWSHLGGHRWRYELEPVDEGTRVVETFDWSTAVAPPVLELLGVPERHKPNMEKSLERLEKVVIEEMPSGV